MKRTGRWRAVLLGVVGGALLGALTIVPARAAPAPTPELLLAAALHAKDVMEANIEPGGWWDDMPEFNDRLEPDTRSDMLGFVTAHVFGKPDEAPAEIATSLHLYETPDGAAAAFAATADGDQQDYGATFDGPKVGDQSRYMRQPADDQHGGGTALRFQAGRYLARIDVGGKAAAIAADRLAALGRIVAARLGEIDAGTLTAPTAPALAQYLPPADAAFQPVLGTATVSSQSWGWIWSNQNAALVVSPRLRALLRERTPGDGPVTRRYRVTASPNNVADLTLMAFRDARAAAQYLTEIKREDPRRAAAGAGISTDSGDITVSPPIPDVASAYRADLVAGRYVAEISCFAPFAPTAATCATAVKELAARVKPLLPAK
ncbi:MAG TPA: hypothetical protein VIJ42_07185 [Stellaceae bacterium]